MEVAEFPYNNLLESGARDLIVAQDIRTGGLAVYDTNKRSLSKFMPTDCDGATVLHTGEPIFSVGGKLVSSPEACASAKRVDGE
jgi:hypothetical protein